MSQLKVNTIRHTSASSDAITLASDGTATAKITNNLSNRNIVINGAMQINQRGDNTGITNAAYIACDRWFTNLSSCGTWSISQSTDAPDGFGYSMKWDCTTADASPAASDVCFCQSRYEGQDLQHLKWGTSGAQSLTLSFWIKSTKTGDIAVCFWQLNSQRMITKTATISSANTWEKKTITIPGDTGGSGFTNDEAGRFQLEFWFDGGSNFQGGSNVDSWGGEANNRRGAGETLALADSTSNDLYLTGIQMEVGDVATDFEHRSMGDELARCQRYYFKRESDDGTDTMFGVGFASSGSYFQTMTFFPVTMRTAPTALETNGTASHYRLNWSGGNNTGSGVTFSTATKYSGQIQFQGGSFTDGQGGYLRSNDSSAYVAWSAEL